MKTNNLALLKQRLEAFGLNPQSWRLVPINKKEILISSRSSTGLSLIGIVKKMNDELEWESLELYSI